MSLVDSLILIAGAFLLAGILSSKFSSGLGVPVLVLFLALGMVAGSEGLGGLEFENYSLAQGIGTLALVVILFDGGLRTDTAVARTAWKPAVSLATIGVLITAGITGCAAAWILKLPLLEGLLLGSIVGSTDAAAVFSVLRSSGVGLDRRLTATLEVESGSNDPMAVFLTVGIIEVLNGQITTVFEFLGLFLAEMFGGAAVGLVVGYAGVWIINRIHLDAAGLYPVLVSACGLLAYGLAASLGGSGFLAVYLAGVVIGNSRIVFKHGIFLFHDAGAWLSQIVMFVVLGLLSFPSRLLGVAGNGLLIAVVLVAVARPLAVVVSLIPFRFKKSELAFLSWVGLRGAVPITLATFPLLSNIPHAHLLFDVVFFVVVVSAMVQGWSLPVVARKLGLEKPAEPAPPVTLEISSLRHVDGDIVDFTVGEDSLAAGRMVKELALPEGVVIALVARNRKSLDPNLTTSVPMYQPAPYSVWLRRKIGLPPAAPPPLNPSKIIPPQGSTRIEAGDHVILVLRPGTRPMVNRIFASREQRPHALPQQVEFNLRGSTTLGELDEFYDIQFGADSKATLDEAMRQRLGSKAATLGGLVELPQIALYIRGLRSDGHIERVGMVILPQPEIAADVGPVEIVSTDSTIPVPESAAPRHTGPASGIGPIPPSKAE